ncbi:MAG: hypothetical protein LAO20_01665 [Acidobacteriia bacterium]|nr:hypothetical protein [Terriglobia bacterium]
MAVARIFTRRPEAAISLSEELRRQGYTVEVVVADQPPVRKDKDLEIDLEFLRLAESPTYSDELITEFVPDTTALAEANKPLAMSSMNLPVVDVPVDAPAFSQSPVVMPEMPPVAILSDSSDSDAQFDSVPEIVNMREAESFTQEPVTVGEDRAAAGPGSALPRWIAALPALAHRVAQSCREQINLGVERVREGRRQRQLALQARQAQAQERAAELQAAREAAAERLQQLLNERGDEAARPVVAYQEAEAEIPEFGPEFDLEPKVEPVPEARPVVRAPIAAFSRDVWRRFSLKPEYVFAGVAALGSLLVVGLALVTLRSTPQLAKLDHPAGTIGQTSGAAVNSGKTAKASRPSPFRREVAARNAGTETAANKITVRRLGADVTIRQYPAASLASRFPTQAKPAALNAQPQLRRISDLQN